MQTSRSVNKPLLYHCLRLDFRALFSNLVLFGVVAAAFNACVLIHKQPNVMVACSQAHVAQARDCIIQLYNPSPAPHVPVRRQP